MNTKSKTLRLPTGAPETIESELQRLLEAGLDLPPDRRRAFFAEVASSPEIAQEAEELLQSESELGSFLIHPAAPSLDDATADLGGDLRLALVFVTIRVGAFKVRHCLGEGGMGRVYLAEQKEPVDRKVAVKLVRGRLSSQLAARFRLERMALGRLSHPNIARLYEAGTTEENRLYVAMELVDGLPITEHCDRETLSIEDRLKLFVAVCRGAQHAHQKQILHRDLKPSNILVAEIDGEAVPKIIDFGIAKSLDRPLTEESLHTGNLLIGTPYYMSPEALERSEEDDLDTRADVYSLGVVLYELLTGVRPFTTSGNDLPRLMREILEKTPAAPSARVTRLAAEQRAELATLRLCRAEQLPRQLAGDLDWIVLKAMAKERRERYDSATELAAELERVLSHQPVLARPPTLQYRLKKWIRRNQLVAGLTATASLGLIAATGLTAIAYLRVQEAEQRSRHEAQVSRQSLDFLVGLFEAASPEQARGEVVDAERLLAVGAKRIRESELEPLPRAQILFTLADVHGRLGLYPRALELAGESLAIREQELSQESAEALASLELLGNLERQAGHLEEAGALLERVAEIVERQGDPLALADTCNSLGNLRMRQERAEEAERYHRRALELRRQHLGESADEVAASHNNLGALLFSSNRFDEAEPHLRRAAELLEERLGLSHPRVAIALGNWGIALQRLGRLAEAERLVRRSLGIRRRVQGPDHPSTSATHNNLATILSDLGRFEESEEHLHRALEIRMRSLGPDHAETLKAKSNLGLLLWRTGRLESAEQVLEETLQQRFDLFGPQDARVASSRLNLAVVWRDSGRIKAAQTEMLEVLDLQHQLLGTDHRSVANTLHHLGVAARMMDRLKEARRFLEDSLATRRRLSSPEGRRSAETLFELGELESLRFRLDRAAAYHEEALELRQKVLPPGHPDLERSIEAVAALPSRSPSKDLE